MHKRRGKVAEGLLLSKALLRYKFRNCIFVLAHMRCGSTALSNILCSRPDISGYGETHVNYGKNAVLSRLALNQLRRGEWKPEAEYLFDKILHSRYDRDASSDFYSARAIFLVREPADAIDSIVRLFAAIGKPEYETHAEAAAYYVERLEMLELHWHRFEPLRRIGLSHRELLQNPGQSLGLISSRLDIRPRLENRYVSPVASRKGGGGDPIVSGKLDRIEPKLLLPSSQKKNLNIPSNLAEEAQERYDRMLTLFAQDVKLDIAQPAS